MLSTVSPVPLVDLNPTPDVDWSTSFVRLGDKTVFVGGNEQTGIELWQTDGSIEGTRVLHDVVPGPSSGLSMDRDSVFRYSGSEIGEFQSTADGGALFFTAGFDDREALWLSDGQNARPIYPGRVDLLSTNDRGAFFSVTTDDRQAIDGNEEIFVGNFNVDAYFVESASGAVTYLTTFQADDDEHSLRSLGRTQDEELLRFCFDDGPPCVVFATDGTAAGTRNIGVDSRQLFTWQGEDYLVDTRRTGLLRINDDGSVGPAVDLTGINLVIDPGGADLPLVVYRDARYDSFSSLNAEPVTLPIPLRSEFHAGESVYFAAPVFSSLREVWATDGTDSGTKRLASFPNALSVEITDTIGDVAVVAATYGSGQVELSIVDANSDDPHQLVRVLSETTGRVRVIDVETDAQDRSYLSMSTPMGQVVWIVDVDAETPEGIASELATLNPGTVGSGSQTFHTLNTGQAIFRADWRGMNPFSNADTVAMITDGTPEGTFNMAANVDEFVTSVYDAGDLALFSTTANRNPFQNRWDSIWVYDPTARTTTPLNSIAESLQGADIVQAESFADQLVFVAERGLQADRELWITDGTVDGTNLLLNVEGHFTVRTFEDEFYLLGNTQNYVSDGTVEGSRELLAGEMVPDATPKDVIVRVNDEFVFTTIDLTNRFGQTWLWNQSDGQTRVVNGGDFRIASPESSLVVGRNVYYIGQSISTGEYRLLRMTTGFGHPEIQVVIDEPVGPRFGFANGQIVLNVYSEANGFEPAAVSVIDGDVDRDGAIDAADLDLVCAALRDGVAYTSNTPLDVDRDYVIDKADVDHLLRFGLQTQPGDVNLNGVFDSEDLVALFESGEYEDDINGNSMWSTGDWNCDGDFDSTDLVLALQMGYQQ